MLAGETGNRSSGADLQRALAVRQLTTSVYSADQLAASEALHRSLFENGIVPGKPALVKWKGASRRSSGLRLERLRERWLGRALNPSFVERALRKWFDHRLPKLCDETGVRLRPRAGNEDLGEEICPLGMKAAPRSRIDQV